MSDEIWILGIAGAYLFLSLVVGVMFGRKSKTDEAQGFVAANRSFGLVLMYFVTGATIFSSFAFLGMPGWAYEKGGAAFYVISYGAVAMVPLYFFGPKVAKWGRAFGYITQADFIADRFGCRILPGLMALVSVLAFVPYLVLQMKGAGFLLSTMTAGKIPESVGALIPYLIVTIYVLIGGVKGVGATNVLQGIFMLLIAWFLGLYIPWKLYGGVGPMFERIVAEQPGHMILPGPTNREIGTYVSDVVIHVLGFTMWPHLFMKVFTSKSDRVLKQTVILYPTFLLFLVPILFLGFAGVLFESGIESGKILPYLVSQMNLPVVIVGLFCAGGLAASMSSGDAILHASSAVLVRDFFKKLFPGLGSRTEASLMKGFVVILGVVSYLLAVAVEMDLVDLLRIGYGGVVQFFPLVVGACYFPRSTRAGALFGLLTGILLTILGQFDLIPRPFSMHPGALGLGANILVFIVVSRMTRPPAETSRFFSSQGE